MKANTFLLFSLWLFAVVVFYVVLARVVLRHGSSCTEIVQRAVIRLSAASALLPFLCPILPFSSLETGLSFPFVCLASICLVHVNVSHIKRPSVPPPLFLFSRLLPCTVLSFSPFLPLSLHPSPPKLSELELCQRVCSRCPPPSLPSFSSSLHCHPSPGSSIRLPTFPLLSPS